jgi:hypothetical protein
VLTHERNRATLSEVHGSWSCEDLVDAHLALDVHDELGRRAHLKALQQADEARAKPRNRRNRR